MEGINQKSINEQRRERAQDVVGFLERAGILDFLSNPREKREYLKTKLTPQIAEDFLKRLGGIINAVPIKKRTIYCDDVYVTYPGTGEVLYNPPSTISQKKCLAIVVNAIKKLNNMSDIAELAALEINLLHMFGDGNGRLARLIYLLLSPDKRITSTDQGLNIIEDYLSERETSLNLNPFIIFEELNLYIGEFTLSKNPLISEIGAALIVNTDDFSIAEGGLDYKLIARGVSDLLSFDLFDASMGLREYVFTVKKGKENNYLIFNKKTKTYNINTTKIIADLKSNEDVNVLLDYLEFAKIARIQIAADMYINPQNYPSKVPGLNLKDYFMREARALRDENTKERGK